MKAASPLSVITTARIPSGQVSLPFVGRVATDPYRLCTLVRPDLVALAKHYTPPNGSKITFFSPNGPEFTQISGFKAFGDLLIARLTKPVESVEPVVCADLQTVKMGDPAADFLAVGLQDLEKIIASPIELKLVYADGKLAKFRQNTVTKLEKGDSGAPILIKNGTEWALVGTNYSITATEAFNNLVGNYITEIASM